MLVLAQWSDFCSAIEEDDCELLRQLCTEYKSQNVNIDDIRGKNNTSLLHVCVSLNKIMCLKVLTEFCLDTNTTDIHYHPPLFYAQTYEACQILKSNKLNIEYKSHKTLHTALHIACAKGYKETVEFILENSYICNEQDIRGYTALHYAVNYLRKDIVKLLLDAGANPKITSFKTCRTPEELCIKTHGCKGEDLARYVHMRSMGSWLPDTKIFSKWWSMLKTQPILLSLIMFILTSMTHEIYKSLI